MYSSIAISLILLTQSRPTPKSPEVAPLAEYFRIETDRIARDPLKGIVSAEQWKARKPELRRQFKEMLGLDPEPTRGNLNVRIHATVDRPDFVIEKISYESSPGLFVTGNVYRPKKVEKPLPAVLYVCGHSQVEQDGVVLGAKTHYQHHAAWYASNGYVCLIVDTLQLGELPGLHHGTSRFGLWWWHSRGYTPAGVEAWNAVRGIDYLVSRQDVDPARIGVTGRSGGGATSWWVAAIDDRVKVAIPVAGITDLKNHVVDGVVQGHCDCMYHVNTYGWDFNLVAALAVPKALLVENTDKDPIFPEDGVRRIFKTVEQVYQWEGASEKLGLAIGKGGHMDTPEIRHPSFAFMNKWLKGDSDQPITEPDRKVPDDQLRVLDPKAQPRSRNASIFETFVETPPAPPVPSTVEEWSRIRDRWQHDLKTKVLAGWPESRDAASLNLVQTSQKQVDGYDLKSYEYQSQPGVRLSCWSIARSVTDQPRRFILMVANESTWKTTWSLVAGAAKGKGRLTAGNGSPSWQHARAEIFSGATLLIVAPRGVGPDAWPVEQDLQIRRRFALLGQTLDGMRVFDVVRAGQVLQQVAGESARGNLLSVGAADSASWLLLASLMNPENLGRITLLDPPSSFRQGPAYLNIERIAPVSCILALSQAESIRVVTSVPQAWDWPLGLQARLNLPAKISVTTRP